MLYNFLGKKFEKLIYVRFEHFKTTFYVRFGFNGHF